MRRIGLLGGMSFESSMIYYRLLNEGVRERLGGLNSADCLLHSVNFDTIATMQSSSRWDEAGQYLAKAASGLEQAGAQCILIGAVTMHLVADAVEQAVHVPLINIVDATAGQLAAAGCRRPLLLATRYTMEHGFYQERMARHGITIITPDSAGRSATHGIIFNELCRGQILDASRRLLVDLIATAKDEGADSVIFGCTEIGLILDPSALPLPAFDSAAIHVAAALDFALG